MNRLVRGLAGLCGAGVVLLALAAASTPAVLTQAQRGLWELDGVPGRSGPQRLCIADTAVLARFEHRSGNCMQTVLRDQERTAAVQYTCSGGGFGQTSLSLITPRSLRIETQGISSNAPFHYVLQARRVGEC